jgi:uncharacterized protein
MPTCLTSELILPLASIASRVLAMKTHSLRVLRLLFALSFLGSIPCAFAASFDCGKAASPTEKLICSDAETSALDDKLQQAYKTALAATDAPGKKALAKEQRNWIKYTRGICQDISCLRQGYTNRIAMLSRDEKYVDNDKSSCVKPGGNQDDIHGCGFYVETYRDPTVRIESFNQSLAHEKQNGRVIGCGRLIGMYVGGMTRGNQNFGGLCVLQDGTQRQNVMICNDDMIGNFQMQLARPQERTDKLLIDFTYAHCYRGS